MSTKPPGPQPGGPTTASQYLRICSDIGCSPLPEVLSALTGGLKKCILTSPTESLPEGQVIALCAILPLASFEDITFTNLNLVINSWAAIADACSKTKSLHRLCFRDCGFKDGQGVAMFARAVAASDLHSLEFVNSKMGDEVIAGLTEGPLLKSDRLHTLRLAGCGVSDSGANRLAKAMELIGMLCSLRVLDLSNNWVGDQGACALAAMLVNEGNASSVPLNSLDLESNQITDVGGLALCKAGKGALMLQRLNLSNNLLTDASLIGMADAIRFNTGTLKEVGIAGCKAREEAVIQLIKAANKNTTLQLLDIRGVPLGPDGVVSLCNLLRYTTALNTLRVDVASAEGAEMIARDLPSNRSLMHITLGGPVPEGLLAHMSEILAANTVRQISGSPVASSPHIHAWIEDSTNAYRSVRAPRAVSPTGGPLPPEPARSPRSEAGGSAYSQATFVTHKTGKTSRTARTNGSYMSFGGFTDISRRTVMVGSAPMRISASLAAGGAAEKAAQMFRKHDQNQDNHLNRQEMLQALEEMGVLNGIKAKHIGRFLDSEFKKADWDKDGRISLQDFVSYYERIAYYQSQMAREGRIKSLTNLNKSMVPTGVENNSLLKKVFKNYCKLSIGQGRVYTNDGLPHMNLAQFHRLCQDAGFMEPEGRLSTTAIDVIFYRYRSNTGIKKLGWKDFITALAATAYEMGMQFDDILDVMGCKKQPMAPAEIRESVSDIDGHNLATDPSFDVAGVPLATVHEGREGAKRAAAAAGQAKPKAAAGTKKTAASAVRTSKSGVRPSANSAVTTNPLYESHDHGAPTQTNFKLVGGASMPRAPGSPGRSSPNAAAAAAISTDMAVMEARLRLEMESQMRALEDKVERQLRSAPGLATAGSGGMGAAQGSSSSSGLPASDAALLGAKLRQLEGQVAGVVCRQDELDRQGSQLSSLQDILTRLAEEIARIKSRPEGGANNAALGEDLRMLSRSVYDLRERVDALARDLSAQVARMDTLQAGGPAARGGADSAGGATSEALATLEKRLGDKQSRYEGALLQVAKQVDALDQRLREEQESNMKALELLMAAVPGAAAAVARK